MIDRRFLCCSLFTLLVLIVAFAGLFSPTAILSPLGPSTLFAQDLKPLDKPPAGQTFVGEKVCSSCHFDQSLTWRKTKHAKGFEVLTEKYRTDKSCLKCHTTGFEEETGFKSVEATPALVGTSCEACHGPGSKHAETAKQFTGKELSDAQKKYVGSSIYRTQPKNVCVGCHLAQGHKKHPEYVKEEAK
ncbi:MAG TPA: cytochrome c family protein [Gemmataceae bacterium]|nr:cytochrome c family protein [Gemmataceae bacterium]